MLTREHQTNFDEVAKESTLTRNASAAYQKLYNLRRKFRQVKPAPDPSLSSSSSSYVVPGGGEGGNSGSEAFGTTNKPFAAKSPGKVVKKSPRRRKKCVDSTLGIMGVGEGNAFDVGKEVANGIGGDWRSSEGFGARIGGGG